MNIFEILCYGDGRVNEPQMSSVLAFILDPTAPHGYKYVPLCKFIESFYSAAEHTLNYLGLKNKDDIQKWINRFESIQLNLEVTSRNEERKRRDLDLVIRFYERKNENPKLIFILENKINDGASAGNSTQLTEQYNFFRSALEEEIGSDAFQIPIIFIYLTPKSVEAPEMKCSKIQWDNFEQLNIKATAHDLSFKINYVWGKEGAALNPAQSISNILSDILYDERIAKINPGSGHSDLLFRSLIKFIDNNFKREDYSMNEIGDNNFTIVDANAFWLAWRDDSRKNRSYYFAQNLIKYVKDYTEEKLSKNNISHQFSVKQLTSKKRLNFYLDEILNPHNIYIKKPKGRILVLRYDGKTSNNILDIIFDRREGLEFEDFNNNFNENSPSGIEFFDSDSNQFRTILHIDIAQFQKIEDSYSFLDIFLDEAINAAIQRFN
jgi:hypothetical protein